MSETPPSPELLDELISAEIDGELDAACRDLGIPPEEAARLVAAAAARRDELARARTLLGAPPPLDDLLAARLRVGARRATAPARRAAGERRRRLRSLRLAGAAAAVLVVGFGVVTVIGRGSDDPGRNLASDRTVPRVTGAIDLGEQPDAGAATRAALSTLASPPAAPGTASGDVGATAREPASASPERASTPATATAAPGVAEAIAACGDAARRFAGTDAAAALAGGARIGAASVTVHAFGERATVVVVVLDGDCRLLARTSATLPG